MRLLNGHRGPVLCLAYSPDGRTLASGGWDQTVRLWDLTADTEPVVLQQGEGNVFALAFAPDGATLAANTSDALLLWDPVGRVRRARFTQTFAARVLAFSPDGGSLATEWSLWNLAGQSSHGYPRAEGRINALAYTPDGQRLVVGTSRTRGGEVLALHPPGPSGRWARVGKHAGDVLCVAASPNGRTAASGGRDHTVKLWDLKKRSLRADLPGHEAMILGLAFTPDGRSLASGSLDGVVKLWDVATARVRIAFDWQVSAVRALAFAPDGMTAAAGGFDGTVVVWDLE